MCIKWHAKCQTDLPYVCVCTASCTEGDCLGQSPSVQLAVHTHRVSLCDI